jgi:hypothetical protein
MFFTAMAYKRKLRKKSSDELSGEALADWLNRQHVQDLAAITADIIALHLGKKCSSAVRQEDDAWLNLFSPARDIDGFRHGQDADYQDPIKWTSQIIGMYVAYDQAAVKYNVLPEDLIRTAFSLGFMGQMLPEKASKGSPVSPEDLQERYAKGSYSPVRLRAEFRPWARGIEFKLVPEDEPSTMLYHFMQLMNSGNVSRLRICKNCHEFWYCAGRSDRQACSTSCKVNLWQKTPAARAKKAKYMREYRGNPRVRARNGTPTGYRRERGRKLHVDLKKGE